MPYVVCALGCLLVGALLGAAIASRVGKMDRKGHVEAVQDAVMTVMSTEYFRTRVLRELGLEEDIDDDDEDFEDEDEAPVIKKRTFKKGDLGYGPFGPVAPVRRRRKRV